MGSDLGSAPPVRRRFAGYEILAELGEHLGLKRYKAIQLALRRPVVLNVLPAESAKKSMCAALFERQMNVFSTLRHENVVGAIEAGEFEGERYFVVEHVEGSTLREGLANAEQWDVPRALRVARDISRALAHLEALKLVHREISPRAITVGEDGTVARKAIVPGPLSNGLRVAREGITGDEWVITKGLHRARPGQKVSPKRETLAVSEASADAAPGKKRE